MAGAVLTREELDGALALVEGDGERIAESLVAMDAHPGHQLLRNAALTGLTARRWTEASAAMATLWEQFATYRALVARAREVRDRRSRPGEEELAELTHVLRGPVVELDAAAVPIERRGLTGPAQVIERITLAELLTRMRRAFDVVTALLAAAEAAWTAAVARLDPLDRRLHAASVLAESVGEDVTALRRDLARARELALTDVLTAQATDVLPDLERRLADAEARLAGLARLRDEFAPRVAALDAVAAEVADLEAAARQTHATVLAKIASPGLPEPTDDGSTALRARLRGLTTRRDTAGWAALAGETEDLERFAAATLDAARTALRAVTGLLDRRAELRGRLEAYQVKAARLGHAEDTELARLHEAAHRILYTAPCDLPGATRALNGYRQALQDRTRSGEERTP